MKKLTSTNFQIPLDFSFYRIQKLKKVSDNSPRVNRLGKEPPMRYGLYISRSLWLSYNEIFCLQNLYDLTRRTMLYPEKLTWIDLSSNKIKHVDDNIFTQFPNLAILYLHNNEMEEFLSVFFLKKVKSLRCLTLHRNPLAQIAEYRAVTIAMVPWLTNLDSIAILPSEKCRTNALREEIVRDLLPKYEKLEDMRKKYVM